MNRWAKFYLVGMLTLLSCDGDHRAISVAPRDSAQPSIRLATLDRADPTTHELAREPGSLMGVDQPSEATGGRLSIQEVDVDVELDGRIARTRARHLFRNHTSSQTEGRWLFRIPEGAAITRLAMRVKGELVEGELVERARATEIYEGIVRQKRDPALFTWHSHGVYSLRVFPFPRFGTREVILEYVEFLPIEGDEAVYRYELPEGMRPDHRFMVGRFDLQIDSATSFEVDGEEAGTGRYTKRDFRPTEPVVVRTSRSDETEVGSGPEHLFWADVALEPDGLKPREARPIVLAIDSSASTDTGELRFVRTVVEELGSNPASAGIASVVSGALAARACDGRRFGTTKFVTRCLGDIEPRGATDLTALLRRALDEAERTGRPTDVVLFSDGVVTWNVGTRDVERLLRRSPGVSVYVVATGERPHLDFLRHIARHGNGEVVVATGSETETASALADVLRTPRVKMEATVVGGEVRQLSPGSVPSGEPVTFVGQAFSEDVQLDVVARSGETKVSRSIELRGDGANEGASIRALWAKRRMVELERTSERPMTEVMELSARSGVMGRHNAFLVLESDRAFRRHSIPRRQHRKRPRHRRSGARRVKTPRIVMGRVSVSGSLDKTLIERVIDSHRNRIRSCYERSVQYNPRIRGRLLVDFSVEEGRVVEAAIESEDIDDGPMRDCILQSVRRWRFPRVKGGGQVTVRYPFRFRLSEPVERSSPTERLEALRKRWPTELDYRTRSELIGLELREGNVEKARECLRRSLSSIGRRKTARAVQRRIDLFSSARVRDKFPSLFIAAALARLKRPDWRPGLRGAFLERAIESADADFNLQSVPAPEAPDELGYFLRRAYRRLTVSEVTAVGETWLKGGSPEVVLNAVGGAAKLRRLFADQIVDAVVEVENPRPSFLDAGTAAAVRADRIDAVVPRVVARCDVAKWEERCLEWLQRLNSNVIARELLARLRARLMRRLEKARRKTPGDVETLTELAESLIASGQREKARATLSEIVEFRPYSPDARWKYRRAARQVGLLEEGGQVVE